MWQAGLGQLRRQHTATQREGTREEFSERATREARRERSQFSVVVLSLALRALMHFEIKVLFQR